MALGSLAIQIDISVGLYPDVSKYVFGSFIIQVSYGRNRMPLNTVQKPRKHIAELWPK
jgi:hypothetical protein